MTNRVDVNNLLLEMRALKSQVQVFQKPQALSEGSVAGVGSISSLTGTTKVPGFGDIMSQAINKVNDTQQASSTLANAYERGVAGVDITDVMVASQKASVSFEAAVQVRNKLVEAYRDVMNMPI